MMKRLFIAFGIAVISVIGAVLVAGFIAGLPIIGGFMQDMIANDAVSAGIAVVIALLIREFAPM
jgi:formate hydrogenlyase subunit 3/multisubunit Na+/H+ antiporter MnhD subunit